MLSKKVTVKTFVREYRKLCGSESELGYIFSFMLALQRVDLTLILTLAPPLTLKTTMAARYYAGLTHSSTHGCHRA